MAQGPGAPGGFSDQALAAPSGPQAPVSLPCCFIFQEEPLCWASVRSESQGAEPPAPGDLPGSACPLSLEGHPELPWLQGYPCGGLAGTWAQVSPSRQNPMVPDPNPAGRTADVGPGRAFAVFMVFEFIVPFNCPGGGVEGQEAVYGPGLSPEWGAALPSLLCERCPHRPCHR